MKPYQISGKLHLSLNACLFGLFFISNTTQAVSPLSDEQLSEQQASILPTKTVVVKKKKPACVNSADKEQVELEKAKDKRGDSCSGENALSAKSKKDESDNEKQSSANKSDDESNAASNSQDDDANNGLSAQKDKSLANESNDNATNDSDLNLLNGGESISALNNENTLQNADAAANAVINGSSLDGKNGIDGSSLADAGKILSAAGLPAGFLDANGNILDPSALERLNTLEAFNLNATDVDKDALQRLLNLQNLQVNTGPDGSTAITLKDTEYESGYIYESITGGGINKGDDIEIPSIRAGLNEVKVIAK